MSSPGSPSSTCNETQHVKGLPVDPCTSSPGTEAPARQLPPKHRQSCQPDQNRSGSGPSTTPEGRPDRIALTIRKGPDAIHERDKQTV